MAAPARPRPATPAAQPAAGVRPLELVTTRDRGLLRAFLERDRLLSGYALCALDERPFQQARWAVALRGADPVALATEQGGPAPQPVFVAGEPEAAELLLRRVIRPWVAYIAARTELMPRVEALYRLDNGPPMVRMAVDRERFRPYLGPVHRLTATSVGELNRMYDLGFTSWLPAEALADGVYYGLRIGGRLVAAAGTHAISREARMGIVGNVMTISPYQGRGYAKATTSAVTAELLRECDDVILNVRADNPPALAAYRALGFREFARFEERLAHRRGGSWDVIIRPLRRFLGGL
jgi:RimJ/RimL family protein N-acetyltransferase